MSISIYLIKKFRRTIVLTLGCFAISYLAAMLFSTTTYAWSLVERTPKSAVEAVGRFLLMVFWPFLPNEVHEQEEMLELLLVWVFSGLAYLPIAVLLVSAWHDARRGQSSSNQTAETQ